MPRQRHPDALDNGLAYIRANANLMALVSSFTFGDSFATLMGRVLAAASISSADMTLGSSGNNRTLSVAAKTDSAADASGGGANNHTVLFDTVNSKVLEVTEESAKQAIIAGNQVNMAGFVITATQPVAP
ncbi:hypothetical protein BN948_01750 [Hydrogenophaga intermedia]|uniref:Uncharacterized protein n=1 Tax=Hydrogenophaga intermedia TaxID=65786 RepID=A0A1L1PCV4_HYDIT|nr:hypothetical protein [Hydrogenophaga intermedia]CDN87330.1 hypothetical protein BN948_01750 [Hydrogenophaga intermedia]